MDATAFALLQSVAAAYRGLRSLSGEVTAVMNSEEEGSRNENRLRVWFAAPHQVRIDRGRGYWLRGTVWD